MDIGFNIVSDSSQFLSAFAQADQATKDLSAETEALSDQSKNMFKGAAKEVDSYTGAIEEGAKATGVMLKEVNRAGASVNVVKKLKEEIRFYTSEAQKAGPGTKAWTDNLAKAGKLKDELNDLNSAVKALNGNLGENFARATGQSLQLVATGYEGIIATQTLLGDNAKEFQETLAQLQSLNAISKVAGEFGGLGDKIEEIRLGFSPVLDVLRSGAGEIATSYSSANDTLKSFFTNFSGNAKSAFTGAVSFVTDFGKNAGSVAKNIGTGFVSFFSNFGANMKAFATSAKNGINTIGVAIKANPLGVILTVITLVIGAFVALKDKVKPIGDPFKALGAIIDAISDGVEKLGELFGFVTTSAEAAANAQIKGHEEALKAIRKKYDYEIKVADLVGGNVQKKEKEKTKAVLEEIGKQISALKYKSQLEGKLEEEDAKKLKEAEYERLDVIRESFLADLKYKKEAEKAAAELQKKQHEDAKKAAEARKKLEQDLNNSLIDLLKKANTAELEGLAGKAKIEKQKQLADEELALLRSNIEKKGKELDKGFKFSAEQEAQFGKIQAEINRKYNNDILADDIRLATERADLKIKQLQSDKDVIDSKQKLFDTETQIKEAQIKLQQKPSGVSEKDFELIKQKEILQIKKGAAIQSLELRIKQSEEETAILIAQAQKEIDILNAKGDATSLADAERLQQSIEGIKANGEAQKKLLQDQTAVIINETQTQIDTVEKEINNSGADIDWAKLLGVSDEQLNQIAKAFNTVENTLANSLSQINDVRQQALDIELEQNQQKIDASNELIDQRRTELDDLESQLQNEIALKQEGFANNIDLIRSEIEAKKQQIEAEKAQKNAALEEEKRIKKEKEKIAKQQFILDTATQFSNLITASTDVFKSLAPIPFVGIPLAIGLISLMFGSFGLAKAQAAKAAGFHDGGYTGDGNEWDEKGPVHAGEYVMTKKETDKHYDLFHGIHTGDNELVMAGIRDLIKGRGISLISDIAPGLQRMKSDVRSNELKIISSNDNSGVERRIDNLESKFDKLIKATDKDHIVLPDGTQIIRKGNNTKTIRPQN